MTTPDNWVILKIQVDNFLTDQSKTIYKVLAGWHGGYLYGDSWRLNSGISKVENDGSCYLFHGYSGSVYKCGKEYERLSSITSGILDSLKAAYPDKVELISYEQFINEFERGD